MSATCLTEGVGHTPAIKMGHSPGSASSPLNAPVLWAQGTARRPHTLDLCWATCCRDRDRSWKRPERGSSARLPRLSRIASTSEATGTVPATGGPQETRRDGGRGWTRSSFCSALVVCEVWGLGEDAWGKQGRRLGPGLNLLLFSRKKGGANTSSLPVGSSQKRGKDSPNLTCLSPCHTCALSQWVCSLTAPQAYPRPHS